MKARGGVLRGVWERLAFIHRRGRKKHDPPGCLFCSMAAEEDDALCGSCAALLGRLARRFAEGSD